MHNKLIALEFLHLCSCSLIQRLCAQGACSTRPARSAGPGLPRARRLAAATRPHGPGGHYGALHDTPSLLQSAAARSEAEMCGGSPFLQNFLGSKEEKNEQKKKHSPLPSGPELSKAQANRRTPVFKCLLCHCHKPKATALITSPCVFGITFFPKKSTRHKYSGNKPFTLKPQPQFAWYVKKPSLQQLPQ